MMPEVSLMEVCVLAGEEVRRVELGRGLIGRSEALIRTCSVFCELGMTRVQSEMSTRRRDVRSTRLYAITTQSRPDFDSFGSSGSGKRRTVPGAEVPHRWTCPISAPHTHTLHVRHHVLVCPVHPPLAALAGIMRDPGSHNGGPCSECRSKSVHLNTICYKSASDKGVLISPTLPNPLTPLCYSILTGSHSLEIEGSVYHNPQLCLCRMWSSGLGRRVFV